MLALLLVCKKNCEWLGEHEFFFFWYKFFFVKEHRHKLFYFAFHFFWIPSDCLMCVNSCCSNEVFKPCRDE